jgi:antibiotic biosynthesis monooxygenase (ABM) superfamily enzyme
MWAQLVKTRVKPGREADTADLQRQLEDRNNPAWVRSMTFYNQENPREHYILVLFESEEAARHHEQHPEQHELVMQLLDCYEEPPEFIHLDLIAEGSRQPSD